MKKLVLVVIVAVLVAVGFAYAAANTVPVTGAGDGQAMISGYTVSDVHYTLKQNDPTRIDELSFKLTPNSTNPNPTNVRITFNNSNNWSTCNHGNGSNASTWTCNVTGNVDVVSVNNLRVVAAQ